MIVDRRLIENIPPIRTINRRGAVVSIHTKASRTLIGQLILTDGGKIPAIDKIFRLAAIPDFVTRIRNQL